MTTIVISADAAPLLDVARQVLDSEDLPDAALIGGLAVTVRVASPATLYRATADIDIVTGDETPTLVQILTTLHDTGEPIVIDGIRVDVIATAPVSDRDLEGIDDGPRLFVASHRWALETAEAVTLTTTAPTADDTSSALNAEHPGTERRDPSVTLRSGIGGDRAIRDDTPHHR
jgi:hypothetical protein